MSFQTTRRSIMIGLPEKDEDAWRRFLEQYTVPAMECLRAFGLSAEDAEDVWQNVLLRHDSWVHAYNPTQGKFRSLLYQELEHRFMDLYRKQRAQKRDVRKTQEADAPVQTEDSEGDALMDQFQDTEARERDESMRYMMEKLEWHLRDFPDVSGKRLYLHWLFEFGGSDQKAYAASKGMTFEAFRHLRKKIHSYLDQQEKE